jgi:hypothetical protein
MYIMNDALLLQCGLSTRFYMLPLAGLDGSLWLITLQISRGGFEKHGRNVLLSAVSKPSGRTFLRYLVVVPTPNVPFLIALAVK